MTMVTVILIALVASFALAIFAYMACFPAATRTKHEPRAASSSGSMAGLR